MPLSPSHCKEQTGSEVTMSQGEQKVSLARQEALVGEKRGSQNQTTPSPSLSAPVPGRILIVLVCRRACALHGDRLVMEEGQEGRLFED